MKLTILALAPLLLACTTCAFSLPARSKAIAPLVDYGAKLKPVLDGLLQTLADADPLLPLPIPIPEINLGDLIGGLIGENQTSPIKGTLKLSNYSLDLLPGGVSEKVVLNVNGIFNPVAIDVVVSLPGIGLAAQEYELDAMLLGIIPVRGKGRFFIGLDVSAGVVETALKLKSPINLIGSFTKFDYLLELRHIIVNFENLMGAPEIGEQFNKIINNLLDDSIVPVIRNLLTTVYPLIRVVLLDLLNEQVKDLDFLKLQEILKLIGIGSVM